MPFLNYFCFSFSCYLCTINETASLFPQPAPSGTNNLPMSLSPLQSDHNFGLTNIQCLKYFVNYDQFPSLVQLFTFPKRQNKNKNKTQFGGKNQKFFLVL